MAFNMSMRATMLGLGMLVLLCGAGVFGVYSYFSRDAQMREAERSYNMLHADRIAAAQAAHAARLRAQQGKTLPRRSAQAAAASETDMSLDDWYADAGSQDEPFDPAPEDKSYLINDAAPTL